MYMWCAVEEEETAFHNVFNPGPVVFYCMANEEGDQDTGVHSVSGRGQQLRRCFPSRRKAVILGGLLLAGIFMGAAVTVVGNDSVTGLAVNPCDAETGGNAASSGTSPGGSDVQTFGSIGGGAEFVREAGTTYSESTADVVASSKSDLMSLDSMASSGDVVFVPGSVSVSLGDDETITVPSGVTLASNRGNNGDGALIEKPSSADVPAVMVEQNGKFTGFRVQGDDAGTHPNDRGTGGLGVEGGDSAEIFNNGISGFAKRCVIAGGNNVHIHHNTITYCNQYGYGYGVSVSTQDVLIEYNRIDYYRHATVAYAGDSYEARFNVIGPNRVNHDIDMHADGDSCGQHCGGDAGTMIVHHNTITSVAETSETGQPMVDMRGVSPETSQVCSNWFYNTNIENPVWQMDNRGGPYENMEVANNQQGEDDPGCSVGAPRESCPEITANGPGC